MTQSAYVDVWVPRRVGPLTYAVPPPWRAQAGVGMRVIVPFRKRRWLIGIVAALRATPPSTHPVEEIRPVLAFPDPHPLVPPATIAWWRRLAEYYLAPEGLVLQHAVPAPFLDIGRWGIALHRKPAEGADAPEWVRRWSAKGGWVALDELGEWRPGAPSLERLLPQWIAEGRARLWEAAPGRPLQFREEVRGQPPAPLPVRAPAQAAFWRAYAEAAADCPEGWVPLEAVFQRMGRPDRRVVRALRKKGMLEWRKVPAGGTAEAIPPLPDAASSASLPWEDPASDDAGRRMEYVPWGREDSWQRLRRAAETAVAAGRQVVWVMPDAWAVQRAVESLEGRFPDRMIPIIPEMADADAAAAFLAARGGEPALFIGTRRPAFWPFPRLDTGAVVGESHPFMKNEFDPFAYHVRDVMMLRPRHSPRMLSLTAYAPSTETYFNIVRGRIHPPDDEWLEFPAPRIYDLRAEEIEGYPAHNWSGFLQRTVLDVLRRGGRAVVVVNRRGTGAFLRCIACGWVATCPECRVGMTYYASPQRLQCRYCRATAPVPRRCPECGGSALHFGGEGVEGVAAALLAEAPSEVVAVERTAFSSLESYAEALAPFLEGRRAVLVTTPYGMRPQTVRNADLLILTGVDVFLGMPSYRAHEQLWGLVAKAGRLIRRLGRPRAAFWVATHMPNHWIWEIIRHQTPDDFYRRELAFRQEFGYPPYRRLVALWLRHPRIERYSSTIDRAVQWLRSKLRRSEVLWSEGAPLLRRGARTVEVLIKMPVEPTEYRDQKKTLAHSIGEFRHRIAPLDVWLDVDPQT